MHNASEACVEFCDYIGALNDLYLWLLYENSISYCSLRTRGSKSLTANPNRVQYANCTTITDL